MVLLASAARAVMPTARPMAVRMSASRVATPKIGLTRPVLVGQPLVSRRLIAFDDETDDSAVCHHAIF